MYLGVDIGGTKTLVALLSNKGEILQSVKFPSNPDYQTFLEDLTREIKNIDLGNAVACCTAVPGLLDRERGIEFALGNLPWKNKLIRDDISERIGGIPVVIENDAKLAGLSEASLLKETYRNVLFLTVSTGIGAAHVQDGELVKPLLNAEAGKMPLVYEGTVRQWEDFAGGRGIVDKFGKKAAEITDPETWKLIGNNIGYGLAILCSVLQPQAVVFGGGVGSHAENFIPVAQAYIDEHMHAVVRRPEALLKAQRPEEAVIYGCFELAHQYHERTT